MEISRTDNLPLGRVFGFLTKQYIGLLAKRMKNTPVERYYNALLFIGQNSGHVSQRQLADHLLTDKVSMVRMLDALEKDGLVERTVNPDDRRQHLLVVTEKAKPWISEIEKAVAEVDAIFLSFLDPEVRTCFPKELRKLCASVIDLPVETIELFYNRIKDTDHDQNN